MPRQLDPTQPQPTRGEQPPRRDARIAPNANHKARARVKTGCQTCRNRKVKCDEGRPACLRCVRTHRTCGGYGVWGGGSPLHPARPSLAERLQVAGPVATASRDECTLLEWFRFRAATKLRGPFGSPFWDALVMQAGVSEPAVFHAVVALCSVHKGGSQGTQSTKLTSSLDQRERFTLLHYSKAINHLLQPHFTPTNRASVRVTLIACMLFICLEFLQGRYKTGNDHLRNGIRLLATLRGDGSTPESSRDAADDWLTEAFLRMNLVAVQFGQGCLMPPSLPRLSNDRHIRLPLITFASVAHARDSLDHLLSVIIHLTERCRQKEDLGSLEDAIPDQRDLADQQRIKSDLQAWLNAYQASRVAFHAQLDSLSRVGHSLLYIFHLMATIMADTCLQPSNQMAFDAHHRAFACIIDRCVAFLALVRAFHAQQDPAFTSSLFTADVGWIPPLYYTALHCRDRRLRRRAVRLLRTIPSREGIWDALFAAAVAREVVRIEEEGEGGGVVSSSSSSSSSLSSSSSSLSSSSSSLSSSSSSTGDDSPDSCSWSQSPSPEVEVSRTLPATSRIYDVRVALPDGPTGRTVLTYRKRTGDGTCMVVSKEFDLAPQTSPSAEKWDMMDADE
ncbi:43faf71b-e4b5-40d8-ae3f-200c48d3c729 [Thermothielavioides terrestris]|uniref:43faf71b-e4b5-40d8-ae3f-200c48d3c729 n=1 Tax=Thermothielavioides terrestris TaxID=2587410 RepID=A0A446BJH7_9PEZI|nr:43faf71b-e4b5-40d8-ae3f-200c48d3c729 [Thermothielavioides terrestris]